MKFLSGCSGVEAFSVACEPLGYTPVGYAEVDPFAAAVLGARFGATAPRYPLSPDDDGLDDDEVRRRVNAIRAIDAQAAAGGFGDLVTNIGDFERLVDEPDILVEADVFVAGTPCQDFSVAGLRAGLDGARGNLTLAYVRTLNAIDDLRSVAGRPACIGLWENVPGVLTDRTNAFGAFLGGLVGADSALVPPDGQRWTDAGLVVGPRRTASWRVLDTQFFGVPQRRARVFVVVSARVGFDPGKVLFEPAGLLRAPPSRPGTGSDAADAAEGGAGGGGGPIPFNPTQITSPQNRSNPQPGDPAPTLVVDGKPPAIAFTIKDHGQDAAVEIAPTMRAMNFSGSHANGGGQIAVAFSLRGRDGANMIEPEMDDVCPALRTGGGGSDKPFVATVAITEGRLYVVRQLMPVECERLQGFPDGHTAITYRGKPAADGPRYRTMGNTKTVDVVRWIGERILREVA